jgi:hypothetical protein
VPPGQQGLEIVSVKIINDSLTVLDYQATAKEIRLGRF